MSRSARILFVAAAVSLGLAPEGAAYLYTPDPARSDLFVTWNGEYSLCQGVLYADGSRDRMRIDVVVRDAFDTPIENCSVEATLSLAGGSDAGDPGDGALCSCDGLQRSGITDAGGQVALELARLGGRGTVSVCVATDCPAGSASLGCATVDFSSPDLDASCDSPSSTGPADLTIWSGGLLSPFKASDYDCNRSTDASDLIIWSGGMGKGCD